MRLLLVIVFAACGSRDAETPSAQEAPSQEEAPSRETSAAPVEMPLDSNAVPQIELAAVADEGVSLRIRVPGPEAVELRRSVRVEEAEGETWNPAGTEYTLRAGCEESAGECITLAAGAELSAPALGPDGQCGAGELEPGSYRFVVESCAAEGTRPHELEMAFTLDP